MEAVIKIEKRVNFIELKCIIGARYWEDTTVDGVEDVDGILIPLRVGDNWCPTINIDTGIIKDWEIGKTAKVHYKCCDNGDYYMIADDGFEFKYPQYYVPNILDISREGYGDYVILNIDKNGKIENWNNTPNIDDWLVEED